MALLRYERVAGQTYARVAAHHGPGFRPDDRPLLLQDWSYYALPAGPPTTIGGVTAHLPDPALPYEVLSVPLGTPAAPGILAWRSATLPNFDDFSASHAPGNPAAPPGPPGWGWDREHCCRCALRPAQHWGCCAYLVFAVIAILLAVATIDRANHPKLRRS